MSTILCYIYEDMADFEVSLLLHRLRNAGCRRVLAISEDAAPVTAQSGLRYWPDLRIQDAPTDAEALIIPGGPIRNDQNAILPLCQAMAAQGKLVAAICFGPQFLGRAGLLRGRSYTTSCSPEKIRELGVADPFPRESYRPARVVQDGNLITAQGYAFVDFAAAVCRYLHVFSSPEQEYDQLGRVKESDGDPLTLDEYQRMAMITLNPDLSKKDVLINGVMGLCGEAGEAIDLVKKHLAQGHELNRDALIKELGDVAWYLAETARALDVSLEEVCQRNLDKLRQRYPEGFSAADSLRRVDAKGGKP